MSANMSADTTQLRYLLEERRQYIVPLFQRGYAWKTKEWQTLWEDILETYALRADKKPHFMGAIVIMNIESQPHGLRNYLLIDGQQRLTTFFILLASIRDHARTRAPDLSEEIVDMYLTNRRKTGEEKYKLIPTHDDRTPFLEIIEGTASSQNPLRKAYDHFAKALDNLELQSVEELWAFFNGIMDQLTLVTVLIDETINPYQIFHSLNGKGQDITQADLVRNYLFMQISRGTFDDDELRQVHGLYWLPVSDALGDKLERYIWHFITMSGEPVKEKAVYEEIRGQLDRNDDSKTSAIGFLKEMHEYSEYYERLLDPSKEMQPEIRKRLMNLKQWDLTTPFPLILNLYRDLEDESKSLSLDDFGGVLDAVESYVIRRAICRIQIRPMTEHFIRMYSVISKAFDVVEASYNYLLDRDFPDDDTFLNAWVRYPLYGTGAKKKKSKHILVSLEEALKTTNELVDTSMAQITQEHIMPQTENLSDAWRELLGEDAEEIHAQLVHTIGNLTLTGMNSTLGTKPFSEKKSVLSNSSFALNSYFASVENWNKEEIVKRARSLGDVAVTIWKRPN